MQGLVPALILFVLSGVVSPLLGQIHPRDREPQFWEQGRLVRLGDDARLHWEGPGLKPRSVPIGPKLFAPGKNDYAEGSLWACLPETQDGEQVLSLYRADGGVKGEREAWVKASLPQGRAFAMYKLPKDRYLLLARRFFRNGQQVSILGLGTKGSDGQVVLQDLIPVDLGDKAFEGAANPKFEGDFHRILYFAGFLMGTTRGTDSILFAHPICGRFLVLNLESLSTRFVRLFPSIKDERYWSKELLDFEPALLGVQPRSDGHYLIASRSEEAVLKAREEFRALGLDQINVPAGDPSKLREDVRQALEIAAQRGKTLKEAVLDRSILLYPEILWWDLDPSSGKITEIPPPPGTPTTLRQASMVRDFRFRLTVRGEVKVFE